MDHVRNLRSFARLYAAESRAEMDAAADEMERLQRAYLEKDAGTVDAAGFHAVCRERDSALLKLDSETNRADHEERLRRTAETCAGSMSNSLEDEIRNHAALALEADHQRKSAKEWFDRMQAAASRLEERSIVEAKLLEQLAVADAYSTRLEKQLEEQGCRLGECQNALLAAQTDRLGADEYTKDLSLRLDAATIENERVRLANVDGTMWVESARGEIDHYRTLWGDSSRLLQDIKADLLLRGNIDTGDHVTVVNLSNTLWNRLCDITGSAVEIPVRVVPLDPFPLCLECGTWHDPNGKHIVTGYPETSPEENKK